MGWPPQVGELLPRAEKPVGIRPKLFAYSLNMTHQHGGPKARGFALILGITIEAIDYLEAEIRAGIRETPVIAVRPNPPFGTNCAVDLRLRGLGESSTRVVTLRTAWLLPSAEVGPRMTSAYLKP